MKGIVGIMDVILVLTVVCIIISGMFTYLGLSTYHEFTEFLKEREITIAADQIEYVKMAIQHALNYGFYDASIYEAENGFEKTYWFDFAPTLPEPDTALKNRMADKLSPFLYTLSSFYGIDIPQISSSDIKTSWKDFTIDQASMSSVEDCVESEQSNGCADLHRDLVQVRIDSGKEITKTLSFGRISDLLDMNSSVMRTNIFKMFEWGKETFVDDDKIGKAVQNAMNNLPDYCFSKSKSYCVSCGCESLEPTECKNYIRTKIMEDRNLNKYFSGLAKQGTDFSMKIEVNNINYFYESKCHATSCEETTSCGCKTRDLNNCVREVCVQYNTSRCEITDPNNPQRCLEYVCTQYRCVEYACLEYYKGNSIDCDYENWKVATDIKVTISSLTEYSTSEGYENINLIFNVRSGDRGALSSPVKSIDCAGGETTTPTTMPEGTTTSSSTTTLPPTTSTTIPVCINGGVCMSSSNCNAMCEGVYQCLTGYCISGCCCNCVTTTTTLPECPYICTQSNLCTGNSGICMSGYKCPLTSPCCCKFE